MKQPSSRTARAGLALLSTLLPFVLAGGGLADSPKTKEGKPAHTNRLARETSPYLLMHAHNPTDWYPWGPEAFAKAKKEGKLIFLSIGYSSCYWCHVMERESFNNPAVAKLLNDWFVCVKVDREERPDIDHIYMTALTVLQEGRGGWPLSMFLTPDAKPIVGGTYWPPEDREVDGVKVRGFKSVLKVVHDIYTSKPQEVAKQAEELARSTVEAFATPVRGLALVDLNRDLVTDAVDAVTERFDKEYGGFGTPANKFRGPKFPTPPFLELFLQRATKTKAPRPKAVSDPAVDLRAMITLTLDRMARGGIYDQIGGGFHRYSTERTWTVPHFEKMLYDNAQLAEVYTRAYRLTKQPVYRRVARETLDFVLRELTGPVGGFYSALDAETHGEEGRFYVWTGPELDAALPDQDANRLFRKVYGADGPPNFEKRYYILTRPRPLGDVAAEMKLTEEQLRARLAPLQQKLIEVRVKRDHPFLNRIVLTAWNGQMIAGFAEAGKTFGEPRYVAAAAKAADFVLTHLRTPEGRLLRSYGAAPGKAPKAQVSGYLEDYAFLVHGLLTLHEVTRTPRWLDEARALTDTMIKYHGDPKAGGYYFTANDHEKLFARSKDQYDGAQPSGNSVAVRNLVRLWAATGDEHYRAEAEKNLKAFAGSLKAFPTSLTTMAQALDMYLDVQEARQRKEPNKTVTPPAR
jgi:uncharacterized protein YyaL (SSP411 family)